MNDRSVPSKEEVLRAALERIARWFGEFPDTGRTWDDGSPMSYGAAFGSNGERDFMRQLARVALETAVVTPETPAEQEFVPVGWQYKFASIWGGFVWRDSPSRHNGSDYTESREIFARPAPKTSGGTP